MELQDSVFQIGGVLLSTRVLGPNGDMSLILKAHGDPDEAGALLDFHFTNPSAGSGRV
jgi:hypothetical protein